MKRFTMRTLMAIGLACVGSSGAQLHADVDDHAPLGNGHMLGTFDMRDPEYGHRDVVVPVSAAEAAAIRRINAQHDPAGQRYDQFLADPVAAGAIQRAKSAYCDRMGYPVKVFGTDNWRLVSKLTVDDIPDVYPCTKCSRH